MNVEAILFLPMKSSPQEKHIVVSTASEQKGRRETRRRKRIRRGKKRRGRDRENEEDQRNAGAEGLSVGTSRSSDRPPTWASGPRLQMTAGMIARKASSSHSGR